MGPRSVSMSSEKAGQECETDDQRENSEYCDDQRNADRITVRVRVGVGASAAQSTVLSDLRTRFIA